MTAFVAFHLPHERHCRKSSLAFDTIYADGQRRYVESLSADARQSLELMQKPDVGQAIAATRTQ